MRTAAESKVTEIAPGIIVFYNREQEHSNQRWVVSCDKGYFNCPTKKEAVKLAKCFIVNECNKFIVFRNIHPNAGAQFIVSAENHIRAIQSVIAHTDTFADGWIAHKLSTANSKLQKRLISESISI